MDKSQHNKLAQIFEQAAEQEAQANPLPEQLWQQIAQELTPPVEAANSIQQAFEEQELSALPPVDVWKPSPPPPPASPLTGLDEKEDDLVTTTRFFLLLLLLL